MTKMFDKFNALHILKRMFDSKIPMENILHCVKYFNSTISLSLSRLYRVQKTYPYRIRSIRFDFIYRFKLLFEQKKMENFSLVFCVHFFFNSVYNTNVFAPQLSLFFVSFWNAFSGLYYLAIKLIHFHNFNEMVYKWLKACIFTWKTLAQRNGSMKTRK